MKKKYISLIPAKEKSLRLKNKNSLILNGKYIFEYTLDASINCKKISSTYVSSDSKKILKKSEIKYAIPIKRPRKFCTDITSSNQLILNFIKSNSKSVSIRDYLVYLQPTSPLRDHKDIEQAINLSIKYPNHTIISVCDASNSVLKFLIKKGNKYSPINTKFFNVNDQSLPKVYKQNGAIYIFSIKDFLKKKKIPLTKIKIFKMNEISSIDLNTKKDLRQIKKIILKK